MGGSWKGPPACSPARSFLLALVAGLAPPLLPVGPLQAFTGHFLVDAYGEEGFQFTDPHQSTSCSATRRAVPLYPALPPSLAGLWPCGSVRASPHGPGSCSSPMVVWVLSSWWMWYYGGSFSGQVFVEYLPSSWSCWPFALKAARGTAWRRPLVLPAWPCWCCARCRRTNTSTTRSIGPTWTDSSTGTCSCGWTGSAERAQFATACSSGKAVLAVQPLAPLLELGLGLGRTGATGFTASSPRSIAARSPRSSGPRHQGRSRPSGHCRRAWPRPAR